MCTRRFVVNRTMLGSREQGWALWNGKEIVEMTSNEIKAALKKGDEIFGLAVEDGKLVPDKGFFCRNIMEHRQVNNYKPMIEDEGCMANVFYIVMGKDEAGLYDVISSKFEKTKVDEVKVIALFEIGCISAGAKVENGKVVLPILDLKEVAKSEAKAETEKPETEKPETEKKVEVPKADDKKQPGTKEVSKPLPEKKEPKPVAASQPTKKEVPATVKK